MRSKPVLLLALLLIGAVLLAFLLSGPARDLVIIPLAKLWWILKGLYGSIPQVELWIGMVVVVAGILLVGLFNSEWGFRARTEDTKEEPGDVQTLAFWLVRGRKGFYSRWHVARQLGDLALEILESSGQNARATRRLSGTGWNPPEAVQRYLDTALRTSFADFSRKSSNGLATALDIDLREVVSYLESAVEMEHEHQEQ